MPAKGRSHGLNDASVFLHEIGHAVDESSGLPSVEIDRRRLSRFLSKNPEWNRSDVQAELRAIKFEERHRLRLLRKRRIGKGELPC
jgi:hypothetical protein